jgi:LPXTG-site transpeptidase (sortase) family protein
VVDLPLNPAFANCDYDSTNNRIQWQGDIDPDPGITDPALANNAVIITFRVTVLAGVNQVNNQGSSLTDIDDDGDFTDETTAASVSVSNVVVWTRGGGGGGPGDPGTLPTTGFAPGVITQLPEQPAEKAYDEGEMVLEIPRLGVKMDIVGVPVVDDEWDTTWLNQDAGWLEGSAYPTWDGNTVLTGHVWDAFNQPGPFAKVKTLRYGDQVRIHAYGMTYIYEVRDNNLITARNTQKVLQHEELDWVTLLTCEFYNPLTDGYLFRRMVRAVLVQVEPIQ